MKCKVIVCGEHRLEDQVNDWLKTGKYEIFKVTQTSSGSTVVTIVYTILYLDLKELRKAKLNKIKNSET